VLKKILALIKSLNSNSHPGEIAHALCIGFLLGLVPKGNVIWFALFFFFLFVRVNKAAMFFSILLVSLLTPLVDTYVELLGYKILTSENLLPLWSNLLNIPFAALTRFNDTLVMGSLITGIAVYLPLYLLARIGISVWRKTVIPAISSSKVFKAFCALPKVSKFISFVSTLDTIDNQ
jgi:uncharacterized protein (TIGR03546 family)